jgi:hypothetical protein
MTIAGAFCLMLSAGVAGGVVRAGDPGVGFLLPSTDRWATVLDKYAADGGVDYSALAGDRENLDAFLTLVAAANLRDAPVGEALAFWINSYNAVTLKFVLDRYPEIESVMDVTGFFKELTARVAGESLTLDEIEARALAFGDPRVHFAVVCASQSCPGLRREPYDGKDLAQQLDEQTRAFLTDTGKGVRLDEEDSTLWLSSIFKWYGEDFVAESSTVGDDARGELVGWIEPFLPDETAALLANSDLSVRFLEYDWSLNDRRH